MYSGNKKKHLTGCELGKVAIKRKIKTKQWREQKMKSADRSHDEISHKKPVGDVIALMCSFSLTCSTRNTSIKARMCCDRARWLWDLRSSATPSPRRRSDAAAGCCEGGGCGGAGAGADASGRSCCAAIATPHPLPSRTLMRMMKVRSGTSRVFRYISGGRRRVCEEYGGLDSNDYSNSSNMKTFETQLYE